MKINKAIFRVYYNNEETDCLDVYESRTLSTEDFQQWLEARQELNLGQINIVDIQKVEEIETDNKEFELRITHLLD